jgi:hypothetical protein
MGSIALPDHAGRSMKSGAPVKLFNPEAGAKKLTSILFQLDNYKILFQAACEEGTVSVSSL